MHGIVISMMRLGRGKPNKVVKDVRIVMLSDVPPKFILRPKVVAAIRREILHDLKNGLKRVPAGAEASYKKASPLRDVMDWIRRRK